ncbi:MAG: copper uptake system-associated protein [Polynucleobacter victoriensis]
MRFLLKIAALSLLCIQSAFAQSSDQEQIKQLMKYQFDKPHAPLSVAPIAVVGDHALASWIQIDSGGRALLVRHHGKWSIALCGGDGLTQVDVLEKTGMSKQVAAQLTKQLVEGESKLSPKHKKMFSMFKGEVKVDHHQH